jgi:hypothetical protein
MYISNEGFVKTFLSCLTLFLIVATSNQSYAHFTGFNHMHPSSISVTLCPGDCHTETVQVDLEKPPSGMDIMFSLDATSSMRSVLDQVKTDAVTIMTDIRTMVPDTNYGVISHRDYPGYDTPMCGYADTYGDTGDWAYRLEQDLTTDMSLVDRALDLLTASGSGDPPESYTRVFYESYADPAIHWRFGSKKILLLFADQYPHDCDVHECLTLPPLTTGLDPGRDEIGGTSDDLPLLNTLDTMLNRGITILGVVPDLDYLAFWD